MPVRLPDETPGLVGLQDLAAETIAKATALPQSTPRALLHDLQMMTALVNTYESNRIESKDTKPADIKRAIEGDLPDDVKRKRLLIEARACALLQTNLNRRSEEGSLPAEITPDLLKLLHREFFAESRDDLVIEYNDGRKRQLEPGEFRGDQMDVTVGEHLAPAGACVEHLVDELCGYYEKHSQGAARRVLDVAAMHHRLLYIHPFGDGNGRTVRLATHARLHMVGIGGAGLWSISRGLARGKMGSDDGKDQYKNMLARADFPRQSSTGDGRGVLSRNTLAEFTEWFLEICLDQIEYMTDIYGLAELRGRLVALAHARLKPKTAENAEPLVRALLVDGEVQRPRAWDIIGLSERAGRMVVKEMLEEKLLYSASERGPLRLELFHPSLFPDLL